MKLTDANKIRDYVKEEINPYGKPFEGSVYEFGLKIMHYIDNMSADYDLDKAVKELEETDGYTVIHKNVHGKVEYSGICIPKNKAIEIVRQGGIGKDVEE